ncbi:hypothetical protein AB0K15_38180 [Amycolatopsis sp. NPDC049253]|uniref:hypothetical protein n=1 Tax=Amycolatopsis sp. NPDC049253 TaxID=3155274 RepID=UPI00342500AC
MTAPRLPEEVGLTALIASYARASRGVLDVDVSTDALPPLGPGREERPSEFWQGLSGLFAGRTGFYDRYLARGRRRTAE